MHLLDVQWDITARNQDSVYVVINYRSLLDQSCHSCKLCLTHEKSSQENYESAKKFVSMLTAQHAHRDTTFFNGFPSMSMERHFQHQFLGAQKSDEDGSFDIGNNTGSCRSLIINALRLCTVKCCSKELSATAKPVINYVDSLLKNYFK